VVFEQKEKRMRRIALALTLLLTAAAALANPLDITDIIGGWDNPQGGTGATIVNVDDQGTDTIRWPSNATAQSGYDFTPGDDITGIDGVPLPGDQVLLGEFVHINFAIPIGSAITSVEYDFGFTVNGTPTSFSATFDFLHNETPNPGDDIVTVSASGGTEITVDGDQHYIFTLLGFSEDGGTTFSEVFSSPEEGSNEVELYGLITRVAVPEPATLALLALGLVGVAGFARRRAL